MDALNQLFNSNDPKEVFQFYSHFPSRESLIDWMQRRPVSEPIIREVAGESDLVIVIPTADYNGVMAKRCREEVFSGQQLVFLESKESPDPFFNFGRFVNLGFARALDYQPHWIAYSGDDVSKVDDIATLKQALSKLNRSEIKTVFCQPSGAYHSVRSKVVRYNLLYFTAMHALGRERRRMAKLLRKFKLTYAPGSPQGLRKTPRFLYSTIHEYIDSTAFGIYSAEFVRAALLSFSTKSISTIEKKVSFLFDSV